MNESAKDCGLDKTTFRVFSSFEEAETADREYYHSLSPAQRLDILLLLREQCSPYSDEPTKGFERVVELLNGNDVRFLIVGGFAVACRGCPGYTSDVNLPFISRARLKRDKAASGRKQNLADLEQL